MNNQEESHTTGNQTSRKPGPALEGIGWYGTMAIVGAYALVSFGLIAPNNAVFQLLNLTGALSIVAISWAKKVRQSVALNAFWALVAAVALVRLLLA